MSGDPLHDEPSDRVTRPHSGWIEHHAESREPVARGVWIRLVDARSRRLRLCVRNPRAGGIGHGIPGGAAAGCDYQDEK